MKNILVTGGNGQLGTELRNLAEQSSSQWYFTDVVERDGVKTYLLDITDREAIKNFALQNEIDTIVNCAAYTNVEGAEDDFARCDLLNRAAAENLASVAALCDTLLIQVSTDFVFDGKNSVPYKEDDKAAPLSVYGKTKFAGELAVASSDCKYLIFRTAWLYSPYGKNFVKTMMKLTAEKDSLKVVADQIGTPTSALTLASLIFDVVENNKYSASGTYHLTDEGVASWYDFAYAVGKICGNSCDVQPCFTEDFPQKATRPHYSVLDKSKVKKDFGFAIPYWRDALEVCIQRLKEQNSL